MNCDSYGEGEPLVLVPGLGCDGRLWGPVVDRLTRPYRIIVPRVWEAGSLALAAEWVAEELEAANCPKAWLAGLSMGGYVAFELLRARPDLFRAAALLDTTAYPDEPERREKRLKVLKLLSQGRFEDVLAPFVRSVLWNGGPREALSKETLLRMCHDLGMESYGRSMRGIMNRGDYRDVLQNCVVPMLFLAGEHDTLTPPGVSAKMAATAKKAQAYSIPEAGHMTALENPGAVTFALESFFGSF